MTPDLEERLFAIEPGWFDRTDVQRSQMIFGFQCGDGWYKLVEKILLEAKARGYTPGEFEVEVVKQKFGELRFDYRGQDPDFQKFVSSVEAESGHVCERCGNPGEKRQRYITLCDMCHKSRKGPFVS